MEKHSRKRSISPCEVPRQSQSRVLHEYEKSIPFLRRLRDILLEENKIISFYPGCHLHGRKQLGRIIVHDRIQLEEKVLPHYFNHSSFASLRRQLNYFHFVRDGNGRQRESTYTNDAVFVLDDILRLRRRTNNSVSPSCTFESKSDCENDTESLNPTDSLITPLKPSRFLVPADTSISPLKSSNSTSDTKRSNDSIKRQLPLKRQKRSERKSFSFQTSCERKNAYDNIVSDESEDERTNKQQSFPLELSKSNPTADDDVIEGCRALLELAAQNWN